jgi:hypothetical protein
MVQRYAFDCVECGKNIQITWEMYTGYYEGHTLCLSCRPAEKVDRILTEEELLRANAELSFEIMLRKKYESFLKSVIRCGESLEDECDFEWFKQRLGTLPKALEVFK